MTDVIKRAIIVHGGAGNAAVERHAGLRDGVRAAAAAGDAILARGGSAHRHGVIARQLSDTMPVASVVEVSRSTAWGSG